MVYFKTLTGNSTRKCISFRNHVTQFTAFLTTFRRSYCPFECVQLSSYYVTPDLSGITKLNHRTWCKDRVKFIIHI